MNDGKRKLKGPKVTQNAKFSIEMMNYVAALKSSQNYCILIYFSKKISVKTYHHKPTRTGIILEQPEHNLLKNLKWEQKGKDLANKKIKLNQPRI